MMLLPLLAAAQKAPISRYQRWELGLQAGIFQGQNDLNSFGTKENNLGGGLLLRYHLDQNVALRGNLIYGEISGDDKNFTTKRAKRGFNFSAPVYEGSIMAELDLLGRRRWENSGKFRRIVSPYLLIGGGMAISRPSTDYNEANNFLIRENIEADKAAVADGKYYNNIDLKDAHFLVPVGFGVKVDINENLVLGLEGGLRILFDDYMDGVSKSGNARKNDTYSMSALTVTYRFPYESDRDRDGIKDADDACPDKKGTEATKGCPDGDEDGVADYMDNCPDIKGGASTQGCPDSDGDGLSDKSDQCPNEKGIFATGGCPDKDKDGIADAKDLCPEAYGTAKMNGCPDSDNDGVKDNEDQCPNEPGLPENNGCPKNDRDNDGVKDAVDKCPDSAGSAAMGGCPDADGDSVADNVDKCPTVAGTAATMGCPEMAENDKKVLDAAIYGVQFEPAKSILKANSFAILDQVADVLQRNPAYSLTISGHTDSDGTMPANQLLSEDRAKVCFDYLVSKGISAKRITHEGFGESRPVADNKTKEGKSKNRRVEFKVKI